MTIRNTVTRTREYMSKLQNFNHPITLATRFPTRLSRIVVFFLVLLLKPSRALLPSDSYLFAEVSLFAHPRRQNTIPLFQLVACSRFLNRRR
ncbi:hypothetical protein ZIOFF_028174 [Zingiber officinale]|uniref:Uncharacterized protein n=1 Tax=Zingiber officinale TaxID=94328 RepID=A0A8J5H5K6_ZINOF|nr:hypothetical protein ZIOFF_028174 [Zingiber officinale]